MTESATQEVLLRGIGMGGYRSLREVQLLGPLRKVTLIAGQNNAGKSNILRFASTLLGLAVPPFTWADTPQPAGPPPRLMMAYAMPDKGLLEPLIRRDMSQPEALHAFLRRDAFHPLGDEAVWLKYSPQSNGGPRIWALDEEFMQGIMDESGPKDRETLAQASTALTNMSGGGQINDLRRILDRIFPFEVPKVESIGAFRQIGNNSGAATESTADHNGRDLISRLAQLAAPPAESYAVDRGRFDAINQFAQTVLEDRGVEIRIPADQSEILVHQAGRVLPLSSLGTGIHQVIILASAATLLEDTLVCIEEPEVHLHPLLQRKLVRYLSEVTTNQYLIATHSAHMLDYERACVLHVTQGPEGTVVHRASTPQAVSDLCADLGYRPSDLIQANAVIWVEGPSDRIYVRHWLQAVAPNEFIEGIHYSIMFYGGALLRHLTADDPSVDEFISLRRLNRHSSILIDSDKTNGKARINATKLRVKAEFDREGMPGFSWITDCRTIENYIPNSILTAAIRDVHPRGRHQPPIDKWDEPLRVLNGSDEKMQVDKVKIARKACDLWADEPLAPHVRRQMNMVVEFIRTANGSSTRLPEQPSA